MPYKLDLFAILIFLGIVQALVLAVFFLARREHSANTFRALLVLSIASCNTEIFLMYSGYIQNCLFLVDFSEPFGLLIGPFIYLTVRATVDGQASRRWWLHMVFPLMYTLAFVPFLFAPDVVKYNSWVEAYQLALPFKPYGEDPRLFWLTDHHTEFALLGMLIYTVLVVREVVLVFKKRDVSFFHPQHPTLINLRDFSFQFLIAALLLLVVKIFHKADTGDHLVAAFLSGIIYTTSFRIMWQSGFFKAANLDEQLKYKSSSLSAESSAELVKRIEQVMRDEKLYLQSEFSLPLLASRVNTSAHHVSQAINDGLGKSFFELAAQYRIDEAKKILIEHKHLKIEEVAERVGYLSKSSFNTAFRKITGQTPSSYRSLGGVSE